MDLSGWIGVGLGGNCDCRCGTLVCCGGVVVFAGLVSLTSPCSRRGVGLPPGFCYGVVCLGLAHLVFYGRESKCVKCRNGQIFVVCASVYMHLR